MAKDLLIEQFRLAKNGAHTCPEGALSRSRHAGPIETLQLGTFCSMVHEVLPFFGQLRSHPKWIRASRWTMGSHSFPSLSSQLERRRSRTRSKERAERRAAVADP